MRAYIIDLGRVGSTCWYCRSEEISCGLARYGPPLSWSAPVCRTHQRIDFSQWPDKAALPEAALTPAVREWRDRHVRLGFCFGGPGWRSDGVATRTLRDESHRLPRTVMFGDSSMERCRLRPFVERRGFVYLAYLDDSGSDARSPVVLVGALVIQDALFAHIESLLGMLVENLVPEEKLAAFQEFHAAELFWGQGVFSDIPQEQRYEGIRHLLGIIGTFRLPFIYSGVDRKALAASPFGGAAPVDAAFRMCALGIQDWLRKPERRRSRFDEATFRSQGHSDEPLCLFIADDTADGALKKTLKQSFKSLRARQRPPYRPEDNRLPMVHDDMYFGSSAESIGIQLADLCCLFMMRHLRERDTDEFYELIRPQAECAKPAPEWMTYRGLFRSHT
jgi:hypothetical protein